MTLLVFSSATYAEELKTLYDVDIYVHFDSGIALKSKIELVDPKPDRDKEITLGVEDIEFCVMYIGIPDDISCYYKLPGEMIKDGIKYHKYGIRKLDILEDA